MCGSVNISTGLEAVETWFGKLLSMAIVQGQHKVFKSRVSPLEFETSGPKVGEVKIKKSLELDPISGPRGLDALKRYLNYHSRGDGTRIYKDLATELKSIENGSTLAFGPLQLFSLGLDTMIGENPLREKDQYPQQYGGPFLWDDTVAELLRFTTLYIKK